MAHVKVCGKQVYYEEYGEGKQPTAVYMQGGPGECCLTYTHQRRCWEKIFMSSVLTDTEYFARMLSRTDKEGM